ncbi:hypothetical protein [Shinella kummerowiae]|uniref:hypothetical protein n=1 Tax=Shinella kummerowiae TaxID=417745 RepID=UPI0021B62C66|nr:hypothetical protein [Shinella kummerowiae]MCT7668181.1 hypothetical protein [Shinella kummerowiae]
MAKQTTPKQSPALGENETLNGSNTLPALIEIAPGNSVQLGEVVLAAFHLSGMTVEAWNALPEADRDGLLNGAIEGLKTAAAAKAEAEAEAARHAQEEADAKAAAEAAALQARLPSFGPRAKQEIRYGGKTYAPGERLPADVDDKTLAELDGIDAI